MKRQANTLWHYLKNYRFNSILLRNFIIILILVILPIIILGSVYNFNTKKIIENEVSELNLYSLYRSADVVDTILQEVSEFGVYMTLQTDIKTFTFADAEEIMRRELQKELAKIAGIFTFTYDYVDSIYFFSEYNSLVISNGEIINIEKFSDISWLETYKAIGKLNYTVQYRKKNEFYPYYITMICPINIGYSNNQGALIINIDVQKLGKFIGNNSNVNQEMFMVDTDGRLYYSSDYSVLGKEEFAPEYIRIINERNENFSDVFTIDGKETILSSVQSTYYPWKYVLMSPLSNYISKTEAMEAFMFKTVLISLIIGIIVSYLLTLRSYEPVKSILKVVDDPTAFDGEYITEENKLNEINHITEIIYNTKLQNKRMKLELEERLQKLNIAQVKALQTQIDPHFLYNTLNTIKWMAVEEMKGENAISNMITLLALLLRNSMSRSSYLVSVAEEIEHVKLYLEIISIRFKDKLHIHWNVGEEILQNKTVKLSLQPLIENAINHGLRQKHYEGNIYINAMSLGETLIISVEDDGVGMEMDRITNLNAHMKKEYIMDESHVGLRNVNQRFKLIFGEKYGVVITPREKKAGLMVTLVFPQINH